MLSVTLEGAEALGARLDGLPAAGLAAIAAKSAELAQRLLERVERKLSGEVLRTRSGALAASIGVGGPTIDDARLVTTLYSEGELKYAAIQEYGGVTSPHDILPSRAKALAFLADGQQVFARHVHHPGSRLPERSYLRSTLTEMAADIEAGMKAAVIEAMRGKTGA